MHFLEMIRQQLIPKNAKQQNRQTLNIRFLRRYLFTGGNFQRRSIHLHAKLGIKATKSAPSHPRCGCKLHRSEEMEGDFGKLNCPQCKLKVLIKIPVSCAGCTHFSRLS